MSAAVNPLKLVNHAIIKIVEAGKMGKRSDFERNPRDFYPTPYEAVIPLLPHLWPSTHFIEPCAGDGRLVGHLEKHGHKCVWASDIEPQAPGINQGDCLLFGGNLPEGEAIITNPPWERSVLHKMIDSFRMKCPTFLLFDSDWAFTSQAVPYLKFCSKIITVGRVSWMENGTSGMDNVCWYAFEACEVKTEFYGKV